MTDERLRAAERRWREAGTVDDEAAYLRERARAGELAPERLRWAAACGHDAALRVAGAVELDLPALQAELTGALEAEARFWVGVVRAGWAELGDDRFLAYLWCWERELLDLPCRSFSVLDYATRASDLLMAVEEHARLSLGRRRGESVATTLPPHLHREPADALSELSRHVPRERIRVVLLREWAPWLLGLDDPIARRVTEQPAPPQVEGVGWQ